MTETYHPDDAWNRSPTPERTQVNYEPAVSPPPYIKSPSPQKDPSGPPSKSSNHQRETDASPLARAGLIFALDPNQPDILRRELEAGYREGESARTTEKDGSDIKDTPANEIAQDALKFLQETPSPPSREPSRFKVEQGLEDVDYIYGRRKEASTTPGKLDQYHGSNEGKSPGRQKHSPRPTGYPHPRSPASDIVPQNEHSATSPNLKVFKIPQSDRPAREALPRMQSLPLSTSPHPSDSQTLPSLQSTLGTQLKKSPMIDKPSVVNGTQHSYAPPPASSPPQKHNTSMKTESQPPGHYLTPQIPPTSFSQTSPPGSGDMPSLSPPSRPGGTYPSYQRAPPKSESSYVTSPFDPGSVGSQMGNSPSTGYPTPTDHPTPTETERLNRINGPLQSNGPLTSSGFKCTHPGCTAAFQTQYLLK